MQIETVLAAGLWKTNVDAHQLESAIVNIAINARDAMPEGGKLTSRDRERLSGRSLLPRERRGRQPANM